jgi:hypothetical protein
MPDGVKSEQATYVGSRRTVRHNGNPACRPLDQRQFMRPLDAAPTGHGGIQRLGGSSLEQD